MTNQRISTSTNQHDLPAVAVIIPNYNGSKYLGESIDSALSQAGVRVEVIIIDDGSTDNSREILEIYGDRIRVYYQKNKGAPVARNLGWKNSNAAYIKFLDSDDVLLPGVLKEQLKQIEKLNENEIPYGEAIWTDEELNPLGGYPVKPIAPGQDPVLHILTQNPLTSAPLHRKVLLERVYGFDERLVKGQEYDLHLRLVLYGVHFFSMSQPIYYFRQGKNPQKISNISIRRNQNKIFAGLLKQEELIRDYFPDKPSSEILRTLSNRYLQFAKACVLEMNLIGSIKFFLKSIQLMIKA